MVLSSVGTQVRFDFDIQLGMETCGHDTSHQFGERPRPCETYNACTMSFSTFVHDLMTLQAPEGQTRTGELRFYRSSLVQRLSAFRRLVSRGAYDDERQPHATCRQPGIRIHKSGHFIVPMELDEIVARLHVSAHVEALKQIVRIRPLHLQPSTATHIYSHTRRAACSTRRNCCTIRPEVVGWAPPV